MERDAPRGTSRRSSPPRCPTRAPRPRRATSRAGRRHATSTARSPRAPRTATTPPDKRNESRSRRASRGPRSDAPPAGAPFRSWRARPVRRPLPAQPDEPGERRRLSGNEPEARRPAVRARRPRPRGPAYGTRRWLGAWQVLLLDLPPLPGSLRALPRTRRTAPIPRRPGPERDASRWRNAERPRRTRESTRAAAARMLCDRSAEAASTQVSDAGVPGKDRAASPQGGGS